MSKLSPQCTTQIELVEHWLAVLKFCKETAVRPEDCWKWRGRGSQGFKIRLDDDPGHYEFAIGLCEGKPVWRDSALYWADGRKLLNDITGLPSGHNWNSLSWTPPRSKTILINGYVVARPVEVVAGKYENENKVRHATEEAAQAFRDAFNRG